jgi:chromosome segregation protein
MSTCSERRLDRLKIERERLGAVNLRAEEEADRVDRARATPVARARRRHRGDHAKLRGAIPTSTARAGSACSKPSTVVNEQFQRAVHPSVRRRHGRAAPDRCDDPLDAGLEIIARPPGKKPQTMTLLSGGEQALTAMALIFAVFLTNPAPICVLDEVDAPLDDANVERFCDLLDEMAQTPTRVFVVITHNPITMAAHGTGCSASATMAEAVRSF